MAGEPINPYAPPNTGASSPALPESERRDNEGQGVWRDGPHLVMERHAQLPAICVKTGRPAKHWVRYKVASKVRPVNLALIAALSPIAAVIVGAVPRTTAHVDLGLCDEVYARYRVNLILGWWLGGIGQLLLAAGVLIAIVWPAQEYPAVVSILLGIGHLTSAFICLLNTKLVDVKDITEDDIWLTGIDSSFLAQLPDYSGLVVSDREETSAAPADGGAGIWCDGLMLVLKHNASFPPVCVVTGQPAEEKLPVSYSAGGQRKTIEFGLNAARFVAHSRQLLIAWLFVPITIIAIAAGLRVAALNQGKNADLAENARVFSICFAPFLLIGTFFFAGRARILTVKKVTPEYVWIIGFCPQVRGIFPEFPPAKLRGEVP